MKISELTPTEVLNDEDIFPVVQDGETKHIKRKDLFKRIPAPSEDDDVASKKYVDEQLKNVKVPVDSALDENSTNAIQNAVVAKEFQGIKNMVNGVFLVYDGIRNVTVRGTGTGYIGDTPYYDVSVNIPINIFSFKWNAETKTADITFKRNNIPPISWGFDESGRINSVQHNYDTTEEYLIVDNSKIYPEVTELALIPMSEIRSLVENDLGGECGRHVMHDNANAGSRLQIQYSYNFRFYDEATRDAFYSEYASTLALVFKSFAIEYTHKKEREMIVSEVI